MLYSLDICFTKERKESQINPILRAAVCGRIGGIEGRESDGLDSLVSC